MDDPLGRVVTRFVECLRARNPAPEFDQRLDAFVHGSGLRLLPCGHTRETWPHHLGAFAADGDKLVVFHVHPGSEDGGACLLADDEGAELVLKGDTPAEVETYLRQIASDLGLTLTESSPDACEVRDG